MLLSDTFIFVYNSSYYLQFNKVIIIIVTVHSARISYAILIDLAERI